MDLALDPDSHDLILDGGDLQLVAGADEIAQSSRIALREFLGEWFLDEREGVDYRGRIFGRRDAAVRDAEIRRVLRSIPGVLSILTYEPTIDRAERSLALRSTLLIDEGEIELVDVIGPAPAPIEEADLVVVEPVYAGFFGDLLLVNEPEDEYPYSGVGTEVVINDPAWIINALDVETDADTTV